MLKERLIIAGIGIPLLIFLCMIKNPVYIAVLFTAFGLIGVWEFNLILKKINISISVYIIGVFTVILGLLPLITNLRADIPLYLMFASAGLFVIMTAGLFIKPPVDRETKEPNAQGLLNTAMSVYVFVFFTILYTLMIQLRAWDDYGGRYLLLVFFAIMAGDSGAYFAGRYLGRHTLIPLISPKKTWEGVLGNFAGNIIGIILYYIFIFRGFKFSILVIIAVFLGFIAILSDLMVSYVKRSAGVKDSGIIFPGHGGVMDRTDSLLFTCAAVIFIVYFMQRSGLL